MAGHRPGPDDGDLVRVDPEERIDAPDQLPGRAGRAVGLGPAVPLDDGGLEAAHRRGEGGRLLDEAEEDRGAGGEVRSDDRGRPGRSEVLANGQPGRVPAGRRDDEPAAAGVERGPDVVGDRPGTGRVDDEVRGREGRRIVTATRGPAEDLDGIAAALQCGADRPPERAVAENDRGHRWCLLVVGATGAFGRPTVVTDESKGRGHRGVRGPWSLRARRLDVGACCAPSEPLGPCLPAGPPELLLRLVGEKEAAHVHTMHLRLEFLQPLAGLPFGGALGRGARGLPRTPNPVDSRGPRPAIGVRRVLGGGLSSIGRASDCGSEGYGFNPRRPPQPPHPGPDRGSLDRLAQRRPCPSDDRMRR